MRTYCLQILCIALFLNSCHFHNDNSSLFVEKIVVADSIPSGSGIAILKDSAYIIGDDARGIYKISLKTFDFRKINLESGANASLYRLSKSTKHDFESLVMGKINNKEYLLAFGSGTLSPHRDSLLVLNLNEENDRRTISLAEFYKRLFQNTIAKDVNIEGAAIAGNDLYLFNRGNNMIFQINWPEFFDYAISTHSKIFPTFKKYKIGLPEISGIQASFSGACTLDSTTILFTASLEDTKNWIDDGEILGSYVGVLKLSDRPPQLGLIFPVQKEGKPLNIKLESLDVSSRNGKEILITSVADNDNGSSGFYCLRMIIE